MMSIFKQWYTFYCIPINSGLFNQLLDVLFDANLHSRFPDNNVHIPCSHVHIMPGITKFTPTPFGSLMRNEHTR